MKVLISLPIAAFLLLHVIVQKVDLYLMDKTYPDLTCHRGYDSEEGKEDGKAAMKQCTARVQNYSDANVCMERCILQWIGILDKKTWSVRSSKEIAIEFVKYTFLENKDGRMGARKLANNIHDSCYKTMEQLKSESMLCKDWGPLYQCIDKAWKCPVNAPKERTTDAQNNTQTDIQKRK